MDKNLQENSDAFQFLFAKMPQRFNTYQAEPVLPRISEDLQLFNTDLCLQKTPLNTIKMQSEEKGIELEEDYSDKFLVQSENLTIGECDTPAGEDSQSACVLLGEDTNDVKTTQIPSESLGLLYKHCMLSSKVEEQEADSCPKDHASNEEKTQDGTFCGDNLKVPISSKQKVEKHSKTQGSPNADWNYFSLRRAWFRGMSAYYKERFNSFVKSSGYSKLLKSEMDNIVSKYIEEEFALVTSGNCNVNSSEFLDAMVTVLHSHRHKKNERYIRSRDFTKIRQVLYSFSTAAKKTFVSNPEYALILSHFYNMQGGEFLQKKSELKPNKFRVELEVELTALYKAVSQTLGL